MGAGVSRCSWEHIGQTHVLTHGEVCPALSAYMPTLIVCRKASMVKILFLQLIHEILVGLIECILHCVGIAVASLTVGLSHLHTDLSTRVCPDGDEISLLRGQGEIHGENPFFLQRERGGIVAGRETVTERPNIDFTLPVRPVKFVILPIEFVMEHVQGVSRSVVSCHCGGHVVDVRPSCAVTDCHSVTRDKGVTSGISRRLQVFWLVHNVKPFLSFY